MTTRSSWSAAASPLFADGRPTERSPADRQDDHRAEPEACNALRSTQSRLQTGAPVDSSAFAEPPWMTKAAGQKTCN